MRFLICGLGAVGRRHLRNLAALGQEDVVLYRTGRATLENEELKDYPVEHDIVRALERWNPEVTIISNPTSMHMNIALAASKAGSHLFIEKPISHSIEGIHELQEIIIENELHAYVGFQFRFHPGFLYVKRLLEHQEIGEVLSAHVIWGEYLPNWHPWEDYRKSYSARKDLGGGVVLTLCHPFDYLRWLLGEVTEVTAETGQSDLLDLEVEDSADVTLRFEAGYRATVHLDYLQRPTIHQLRIVGSDGILLWDHADGSVRWWSADSSELPTFTVPKGFERNQLFMDEIEHFLQVISGEAESRCSLEDGIKALEIALAVHQSAEHGKRIYLNR